MSEVPEVFDVFEKKLAQVLSFTLVTHPNSTKKAVEELLTYFSSVVERASKAESRIAELEAERRWIPVSERLPEGDAVLVYRERGKSNIDIDWTFIEGGREYWYNSGLDNVTHWMPLPEPPEVTE